MIHTTHNADNTDNTYDTIPPACPAYPAYPAYPELISRLAGWNILVVGDVTLDEYRYGRATRLSREAPVPVLEMTHREVILGAAANPARNIVAMGSKAIQVGVVGDDEEGAQLKEALHHAGISPAGILTLPDRSTTTKTRIMAHEPPRLPHHVARLDRVDRRPLARTHEEQLLEMVAGFIPHVNAVLCSDYQLGLLSPHVVDTIRTLCKHHQVAFTVDAQGNAHYYWGVDLFRCNDVEASTALDGMPFQEEEDIRSGIGILQARLQAQVVMVTRGPRGVSIIGENVDYLHIDATDVSEVYDTTGAGDTFIALATLAHVAGIAPALGARLASIASALVVRKFGNSVTTPEELRAAAMA
jgi:rfaE bifunctional protein kinase chain/domain